MNSRTKELIAIGVTLVIIAAAIGLVSALGVFTPKTDTETVTYYSPAADRISVSVSDTSFEYDIPEGQTGLCSASFTLSLKKTQGDFYAVLNGFDVTGISYQNLVVAAVSDSAQKAPDGSAELTATDGTPDEFVYELTLTFDSSLIGNSSPVLHLDITSGMTEDSSVRAVKDVPLDFSNA